MLDNAVTSIEITVPGGEISDTFRWSGMLLIQKCNLDEIQVRIDNNSHFLAYEGFSLMANANFSQFVVDNSNSGEAAVLTLGLSKFIVSGSPQQRQPRKFTSGQGPAILTNAANVLLLPENKNRKYWEIWNNSGQRIIMNSSTTLEEGIRVDNSGGYYSNNNTAAIYVRSATATNIPASDYMVAEHE